MPIADDVVLGEGVAIAHVELVNLYGCKIGDHSRVGPFVEIQKNVVVGARCKISSHSFLCAGVTLEDDVFIGHGVIFINDRRPRASANDKLLTEGEWNLLPTVVRRGASIGSGALILGGVEIGEGALVGTGAVVNRDVAPFATVVGMPARLLARSSNEGAGA